MTTIDLLKTNIYPNLNIERLLPEIFLKDRGNSFAFICPSCGKKEAYMIKKQNTIVPFISCNRLNKCAYNSSLWDYIKNRENFTNKETLEYLAVHANVDLVDFSYHKTSSRFQKKHRVKKQQKEPIREEKTQRYYKMELLMRDFTALPKDLQFSTIVTFIYNFSLRHGQDIKISYYKTRGIKNIEKLGCLGYHNIRALEKELLLNFKIQILQEFGIFKNNRFKYNFSNFSVIPSFDIYSNLITAIRLRNLNLSKIKEIEISHARIANPLPFGITREKLKKYNTFYFTEGHIDALSLGLENFVAVEGVNSLNKSNLTIFKNKKIFILFDQDEAGIKGAQRLSSFMQELNIEYKIIKWNKKFGKDINELLLKNNMHILSSSFYH